MGWREVLRPPHVEHCQSCRKGQEFETNGRIFTEELVATMKDYWTRMAVIFPWKMDLIPLVMASYQSLLSSLSISLSLQKCEGTWLSITAEFGTPYREPQKLSFALYSLIRRSEKNLTEEKGRKRKRFEETTEQERTKWKIQKTSPISRRKQNRRKKRQASKALAADTRSASLLTTGFVAAAEGEMACRCRQRYGFVSDYSQPLWQNRLNALNDIPVILLLSWPRRMAMHDLCTSLRPPSGCQLLLGLTQKFCIERLEVYVNERPWPHRAYVPLGETTSAVRQ